MYQYNIYYIIDIYYKNNYNFRCIVYVCIDEKVRNEVLYIFLVCFLVNRFWFEIIYFCYKFFGVMDLIQSIGL